MLIIFQQSSLLALPALAAGQKPSAPAHWPDLRSFLDLGVSRRAHAADCDSQQETERQWINNPTHFFIFMAFTYLLQFKKILKN
ncbi:MAG: hypothetical protein HZT40_14980 [Candidatus Thiothrix singaporensis]|uniref:Secreted protein n=1 Tax=Candidatus Thiothrix singaporensis TaxID=2799669 RepID=A0A7L6AU86_9GAMM|nr:MAG: hypothetical protein HZT40_14980 [Candidatus Thiothrix singaporensis]